MADQWANLGDRTVILIYLLIALVPMLAGYGVMELLLRGRGSEFTTFLMLGA